MSSLPLEACRLLLAACCLKLAACPFFASLYKYLGARHNQPTPGSLCSSGGGALTDPRSLKPIIVATMERFIQRPGISLIPEPAGPRVRFSTGSGISSSCACVWISFNLLYTTTRSCPKNFNKLDPMKFKLKFLYPI